MTGGVSRRDRTLRRFRTLDLSLGLGFAALLAGLVLTHTLSFWQAYALITLLLAPAFMVMSWRQYVILDEYGRMNLLKAYAASGIVTMGSLILLIAWCAWKSPQLAPAQLIGVLSLVFSLGWAASWVTWFWLRRGHG